LGAIFCETKITRVAAELGLAIAFQLAVKKRGKIAGSRRRGGGRESVTQFKVNGT
jgi:hypothetical protein